jgi:ABC-2 type transport system permease protein
VRDGESAQTLTFMFFFPVMFLSGIFVPVEGMPAVLRTIAEWSPLHHPVLTTLLWVAALTAVFAPLASAATRG